jgi:hypothetical protein
VYSDFCKIPLPALRFEKIEEIDISNDDTTKRDDAFEVEMTFGTLIKSAKKAVKRRFLKEKYDT